MSEKTYTLMIPGPIQPDQEVMDAMSAPVFPHYGDDWMGFYGGIIEQLKTVFGTSGDTFLMPGSGSVGLDTCVGSTFSEGEKVIVGNNGFFGDRIKGIAEGHHLQVVEVKADWGVPLSAADFEKAFEQHPDAKGAIVVHLETSTTVINPIQEIGKIVRAKGGYYVVDAVCSLGAVPFKMDEWNIDLCASASQKCLGSTPGLAPVAVGPRGWEAIDRPENKTFGWYINLKTWRHFKETLPWHPTPVTMPVTNVLAFKVALDQLEKEGINNRLDRYTKQAMHLRNGLRKMGFEIVTPDDQLAPVLTAAYGLEGMDIADLITYLKKEHQIMISPGLGKLNGKIFRVGHMSPIMNIEDMDNLLNAIAQYLKK